MKTKIFFLSVFFIVFFLFFIPFAQASLIGDIWYKTLAFFGIIEITNANHLNSNRIVVSDIYNEVKAQDNIWSEEIPDGDYVRVSFERKLTKENDITIYSRIKSGNPRIEVYEKDENNVVAEFSQINSNQRNKVFLTNLVSESQDTFDLKILDGSVELDYIVDPTLFEIIANNSNQAYNGTLDDLTIIPTQNSSLNSGDYAKINGKNGVTFSPPGHTSTFDTYIFVNFTVPKNYTQITATIWGNTSTGTLGMALWNFTSGGWKSVSTITSTTLVNLTYKVSALTNFVSNNQIKVMAYDNSNADSFLWVDYIYVNVTVDTDPPYFTHAISNFELANGSSFNYDVNATDDGVGLQSYMVNHTNFTINSSGWISNVSLLEVNLYWINLSINDSARNSNSTIFYVNVTVASDTCTCAGLNTNWAINMGDSCNIASNCNLGTGNITFTGTGTTIFNATISAMNMAYPTANQILKIGSNAVLNIG